MSNKTTVTWNEGSTAHSLVIDEAKRTVTYHEGGKLAYQSDDLPTITKFEDGLTPLFAVLFRHHYNSLLGTEVS